jgi:magnesium transporter
MKINMEYLAENTKQMSNQEVKQALSRIPLTDLIDMWDYLPPEDMVKVFLQLDLSAKVDLIHALPISLQEFIIQQLSTAHIKLLLEEMEPDDITDFMQAVSPEVKDSVWKSLSDEAKKETQFLLRFDEDDAAGLMTPRYLAIQSSLSVAQALRWVRKNVYDVETVYYIYVVDKLKRLQGVLSLRDILSGQDEDKIEDIMVKNVITVREETDQEEVAKILETYDLLALPVVDGYNRLLGIITFDDVIDVIREEQTEDIYKMGAMGGSVVPYLESSVWDLVKKRIPWLTILLIAATFTANIIDLFKSVYRDALFLVPFMQLIIGTGGNSGTQSSTLMIRGLATGELEFKDIGRVLLKEIMVGALIGIVMGCLTIVRVIIFNLGLAFTEVMMNGVAIGLAMSFVVVVATLIGAFAPLIIKKLGFDTAVAAGPLMATVIDVCGLTIYFQTVRVILNL